jgi:malonyl-CoA/methylmalonyl-CoA synthetase
MSSSPDPPDPAESAPASGASLGAIFVEQLTRVAAEDAERPLLVELDSDGGAKQSHTAEQLLAQIARWTGRLAAAGLETGEQVALCPARDANLAALHVAAFARGLTIVPLNSALKPGELTTLLLDSRPTLVISEPEFAQRNVEAAEALERPWWVTSEPTGGLKPPFVLAPRTEPEQTGVAAVDVGCGENALVLYTSGTTGTPKSVPLTHDNLKANLEVLGELWQRSPTDTLLHMLPAHHFHGLVLGLYGSLFVGGALLLMPRFDARAALDVLTSGSANVVMGVPTMYHRMLDAAAVGDDLSSLRLAASGSAPLSSVIWDRFRKRFGVELVERYGLTETGILTANPLDAPRAGSAGRVLEGTKLVIRDDDRYVRPVEGRMSPRGEICVAGPSVATGYGNDPDATVDAFHDELFHTGDLGYVDEDGYLWIVGRIKDLIIVGGSNVAPGEVEHALSWVDGVAELAVCGAPDADLGEIVIAYVVAEPGSAEPSEVEARLQRAAGEELAAYKHPRRYVFVEELPRNAMGKIDRARLKSAA